MTPAQHEGGKPVTTSPTRGWLPVRPRERLQAAADTLFPTSIRAVSIDVISAEANVPKSGFYRHFPGKDDLVLDYLQRRSDEIRAALVRIDAATADPVQRLVELVTLEQDNAVLLRAAAEFPEPGTDINLLTSRHRQWIRQWIANQLLEVGFDDPRFLALELAAIFDALTFELDGSTEHDQTRTVLLQRFKTLRP
jgi:AcrR family transcriptional regulator